MAGYTETVVPRQTLNRRNFLKAGALAVPALWATRRSRAAGDASYAYVGTYTPNGGGIYLYRLDATSGELTQLRVTDGIVNPSWLVLNSSQDRLYAVSEIDSFEGTHEGGVVSYAIDPDTRSLTRLGAVRSGGATPAHISLHPSGRFALVSNYGGGSVAVLPVGDDGALGEPVDVRPSIGARHHAHAVDDPAGQFAPSDHDSPHPHMTAADPTGQFVLANDAGLDLTLVWRLDLSNGRLLPASAPVITAPSGSAPRHFAFHPNGRHLYNLYEHDSMLAIYDYDSKGGFRLKQTLSTLPPKFAGSTLASEVLVSADGRFLYAANRMHSAIAVFSVAENGELHPLGEHWVHADSPRSIGIEPTGQFLYSLNQRSDSITSFRIDGASGALAFTGLFEPVGSPAVIAFLKNA